MVRAMAVAGLRGGTSPASGAGAPRVRHKRKRLAQKDGGGLGVLTVHWVGRRVVAGRPAMRLRGGAGQSSRSGRCWASPGSWIPRKASTSICEDVPGVRGGRGSPSANNRGGAVSSPPRSLGENPMCSGLGVASKGLGVLRGIEAELKRGPAGVELQRSGRSSAKQGLGMAELGGCGARVTVAALAWGMGSRESRDGLKGTSRGSRRVLGKEGSPGISA